jgi:MazG family protein
MLTPGEKRFIPDGEFEPIRQGPQAQTSRPAPHPATAKDIKAEDMDGEERQKRKTVADLLQIMKTLRTPGTGCPWDVEQTFRSIAPYTIEEAYEVAHAIDQNDMIELKEELGDLLFQVVFHAEMAAEAGAFDFHDVVDAVSRKMIRRHPHVFGDAEARRAGNVPGQWERIKAEEKTAKARRAGEAPPSGLLDDIPVTLPGLARAVKLQNRAAKVGFDWENVNDVFAKGREEFEELAAEIESGAGKARIEEELGDILFVMANVARWVDVDPESALRGANAKFVRRFRKIEAWLAESGRRPEDSNLEEMDALWNRARAEDKKRAGEPGT